MTQFDKLDAYQVALTFVRRTRPLIMRLRKEDPIIADQLHRAVISILLNIAEGAGEYSPRDKAKFYRYALRSAAECVAILDACRAIDLTSDTEYTECREAGIRIVAIMTKLAASAMKRTPIRKSI